MRKAQGGEARDRSGFGARKTSPFTCCWFDSAANTSVRVLGSSCRPPTTAALPFASLPQIAKYVVALGEDVAPTDIEEGMRVGVDRVKYSIMLPLPPKIDPRQVPCLAFSPPPALSTPSLTTFSVSPCVLGPRNFSLTRRSHSISLTRAQGVPKYMIGFGRGKGWESWGKTG